MVTRLQRLIFAGFLSGLAAISYGHNLGTFARVWPIREVNLKQVIAKELSSVDTRAIDTTLKSKAQNFGANLPPNALPNATQTATHYVNPSIALKKDIIVRGRLLYKKGTWVNPLRVVRPVKDMLFFNGDDKAQRRFALAALKAHPYRLMLVMTKGNPIKLAKTLKRPVYYATKGIVSRFHIKAVPSLLGVGQDVHEYDLAITTFHTPYSLPLIQADWFGINCGRVRP